jgi:hypothetical protein
MSTGATISIMTLLSTVEANGVHFIQCCILSGWGSLSTLIPSVWSLKEVGPQNHLLLWGDKSLASRLSHVLRTLQDKAEDRSSRRRTDVGPRVGVLLNITLLLALECQYSSPILEHKSLVIQTIEETLLLLLIGIHIVWSVAGKLYETSDILGHHHGSFLQILELLL